MSDPASQFSVSDLDRKARRALVGWLDDAAKADIDIDDLSSIQRAYESYFASVLATAPADREDPTSMLTMIGMALGEHVQRNSPLVWRVVSDARGSDLGLATPDGSGAFFPVDPVAANWSEQRRDWIVPFGQELLERLSGDASDERDNGSDGAQTER